MQFQNLNQKTIEIMIIDQNIFVIQEINILKCHILRQEICLQKIRQWFINVVDFNQVNTVFHLVLKHSKDGLQHFLILHKERKE